MADSTLTLPSKLTRTVMVGDRVVVDLKHAKTTREGTVMKVIQRDGTGSSPLITLDGPHESVGGTKPRPFSCSAHFITAFMSRGAGVQARTLVYETDYPTYTSCRDKRRKGTLVGYSLLNLIERCLRGFAGIERIVHAQRALARYERDGCPGLVNRPTPRNDGEWRSLSYFSHEENFWRVHEKAFKRWVRTVARQIAYTKKERNQEVDAVEDEIAAQDRRFMERDIEDWFDNNPRSGDYDPRDPDERTFVYDDRIY